MTAVDRSQVQRLAYAGYVGDCSLHLVLRVVDAAQARAVLRTWLADRQVIFADQRGQLEGVDIGFTYRGLEALQLPDPLLRTLRERAPAFAAGAPVRATRHLGDSGDSAPAGWEPMFEIDRAHVLLAIHADAADGTEDKADELADVPGARDAFSGWEDGRIAAAHLPGQRTEDGRKVRSVHFGLRDNVTRPTIDADGGDPHQLHPPGELLLGHRNRLAFDRWGDGTLARDVRTFFRNGSFAALRKIQQYEDAFEDYLRAQAARLQGESPSPRPITAAYLRAKMAGRWDNGALVQPGETAPPLQVPPDHGFGERDPRALGCPFGAHVRRTNPRDDPLRPKRQRPLFRRGMPYGPPAAENAGAERGLVGMFFCASLEDQFEHLISEWVEKNPMGPDNRGNAKDPLIGQHDDPTAEFHIPRPSGPPLVLKFDRPFVRTRGTLYAFFPSRNALGRIARAGTETEPAGTGADAAAAAAAPAARGAPQGGAPAGAPRGESAQAVRGSEAGLADDSAPRDRFCDLVLEGGITSGIVYAPAVVELARHYRFANIAGSSIGSFAAALAAAAEYGRRHGSMTGYQALAALPTRLAEQEGKSGNRTVLERLFRPQPRTKRLFAVFHAMLGRKSVRRRVFDALGAARRAYGGLALGGAAVAAIVVLAGPLVGAACAAVGWCAPSPPWPAQAALSLLLFVVAAVLGALVVVPLFGIARDLLFGLVDNGFGLCRGWNERSADGVPDLTGYLHEGIQAAAGRDPLHDDPLTFADLHAAPGSPQEVMEAPEPASGRRSINLQVYASHLVHGRPYRFPIEESDDTGRLYFRPAELSHYFPPAVMDYLRRVSRPYAPKSPSDPEPGRCTVGLLELPSDRLPIVVAARMAMSFPLLISAVPVWSIDYEAVRGKRRLKRCWMSDGGLCSNFPIHLFDCLVPRWPTFGISLEKRNAFDDRPVCLPDTHRRGRADDWARGIEPDQQLKLCPGRARRLGSFLLAVWNTTWAWNDQTLKRMPGVRDRVVRIRLDDNEGGVNLRMTGVEILHLAHHYGKPAGEAFVAKFVHGQGWDEHRWVRFNRTLIALRQQITGFAFAAGLNRHAKPLADQTLDAERIAPLRKHPNDPPEPSEVPLSPEQAFELHALRQALERLEAAFEQAGDTKPYNAVPLPTMRVRPPY